VNISRKVKKQGIVAAVFLLILVHLLMRAAYDIENSLGDDETLGARLCSAMLRQGVQFSTPYILYANGSGYTIKGIRDQMIKNMPLEMCLFLGAEKDSNITEYRQPSAIEEMAAIENSLAIENGAAIENSLAYENSLKNAVDTESHSEGVTNTQQEPEQAVLAENTAGTFVPVQTPVAMYSEQQLAEPGFIKSAFYAEDATTQIRTDQLQYDTLMGFDATLKQDNSNVQILVYHTHSQEAYIDSIPGDPSTSIVGVGEHLCEILRTQYGFNVLHHTGEYDVESRDNAYSNAMVGLDSVLAEHPTIEVMIDLHRDQTNPDTKLVTTIQDRPTARFMFFNGLCYTRALGELTNLPNPYVQDNLSFAFQMHLAAEEFYPGLTRRIYLKGYRYNLHYRPKSVLIELGSQTNTVEEAMNACDPMAHIIAMTLNGENKAGNE
jgi:stage II sporulation protein P